MAYDWPGNVRELERLIERAVALADTDVIELDDLPPRVRGDYAAVLSPSLRRNDTLRAWGSRYARLVLERCGGQQARSLPRARTSAITRCRRTCAFPSATGDGGHPPAPSHDRRGQT